MLKRWTISALRFQRINGMWCNVMSPILSSYSYFLLPVSLSCFFLKVAHSMWICVCHLLLLYNTHTHNSQQQQQKCVLIPWDTLIRALCLIKTESYIFDIRQSAQFSYSVWHSKLIQTTKFSILTWTHNTHACHIE